LAYGKAAYRLRGEYARLNFSNLKETGAHLAAGSLHSSVDAKLQAIICQSLENSGKKGGNESSVSASETKPKTQKSRPVVS